eukprot:GHVR01026467.1.p1 GENE.GHVR01026467.1~~GHVR01026467.1.p1  ORF type:complete len:165 (+),score=10.13 GHVR01026467.1:408-902(+)
MLFDSIQKLKKLDHEIRLYPGHGSGSACGKSIGAGNFCNLGNQHKNNYGFLSDKKEIFVEKVIIGMPKPPQYFFHDAKLNQTGVKSGFSAILEKTNVAIPLNDFAKLAEKLHIIDTRVCTEDGLIKGSYWLPSKGTMSNWAAMIMKPEDEFLIVCEPNKSEEII